MLAALPDDERASLRREAEATARRLNPELEGLGLIIQTERHLGLLLQKLTSTPNPTPTP